jgi:hypothetical protein
MGLPVISTSKRRGIFLSVWFLVPICLLLLSVLISAVVRVFRAPV